MSRSVGALRRSVYGGWNSFWFEKGNSFTIGFFRILFAYCLWREVGTTSARSVFAVEGGFHLPYVSFIEPVSRQVYDWIHLAQYPLVIWLGIGFFSRFAAGGLLALQGYIFFADQMNFRNHPYFFMLILLFFLFAPLDDAVSVRRWLRSRRSDACDPRAYLGTLAPLTAQRLIQVQVCVVYVYAALHKINGYYLSGGFLARMFSKDLFDDLSGDFLQVFLSRDVLVWLRELTTEPHWFILPAILTIAVELSLPFALWSRRLRPYAFLAGLGLHGSIAMVMNIKTFSIASLAAYVLFLHPDTLPRWLQRQFGDEPRPPMPEPMEADA